MKTVSIQQLLDHDPDWFWDEPGPWSNAVAEAVANGGDYQEAKLFLEDIFLEMARLSNAELEDTINEYPEVLEQLRQDVADRT
jgi:hypothetical protein